jgi:internalin A
MPASRVVFGVGSAALAALLAARGGPAAGQDAPRKGPDPDEAALKSLGVRVKRDAGRPGNPVVEVVVYKEELTDADLKHLARFDHLRKLDVRGRGYTGAGFAALAGLPLEELVTSWAGTDDGLPAVAKLTSLRVLRLHAGKHTDAGMPALAALANLEELAVSSNFEVKDVGTGKALAGMKKLRKLDVNNSRVGDGAMAAAAAHNPELRVLHLYGSAVTDAGYRHVGKMAKLEDLRCSYDITDAGLAALAGLNRLKRLSAWNSSVTYDGVRRSPLLPRLTDLELGGALNRVTPDQADDLRKLAPDCNVRVR